MAVGGAAVSGTVRYLTNNVTIKSDNGAVKSVRNRRFFANRQE